MAGKQRALDAGYSGACYPSNWINAMYNGHVFVLTISPNMTVLLVVLSRWTLLAAPLAISFDGFLL